MENESTGLDIGAAADSIGAELFPSTSDSTPTEPVATEAAPEAAPEVDATAPAPPEPLAALREVPKSWPQEMHEYWQKSDPKLQEFWEKRERQMLDGLSSYKTDADYGKSLREVFAPHLHTIRSQGLDEGKALAFLLNAHQRLTGGTPESRRAAYEELGRNMGLTTDPQAPPLDPAVQRLQQQLEAIQSGLTAQQQAAMEQARATATQEVEKFAADPAHPYFDELTDDIVRLVNTGMSLQDAYERAVWMNPVTRAKEQQKALTAHEAKLKENARLDALPKKKAASVNVRSRDSAQAPTEPVGSWEDTLRSTLADIRARTH